MRAFFIGGSMDGNYLDIDENENIICCASTLEKWKREYSTVVGGTRLNIYLLNQEPISNTITVTPPAIHFCKYCKHRLPDKDETAFCRMGQVDYVNSCRGLARCYEKNRDGLCKDFKAKA
jgi:hypothetical protein